MEAATEESAAPPPAWTGTAIPLEAGTEAAAPAAEAWTDENAILVEAGTEAAAPAAGPGTAMSLAEVAVSVKAGA